MSTDSTAPRTLPGRASRAPVSLSREARYTLSTLAPAQPLPVVIQASVGGLGLPGWVAENAALVKETLRGAGGILFRGFEVGSPEAFEECVTALSGQPLEYTYRSTPRRRVSGNIYTSTEYPRRPQHPASQRNGVLTRLADEAVVLLDDGRGLWR
jgi:hypothetical protein